jgi:LPS-assembly protein
VLSQESAATLQINFLRDKTIDTPENDYKSDGLLRTTSNRYWIRGKANHVFAEDMVALLDLDLVSDRDYLQEYKQGMTGFDKSNLYFQKNFHRGFQAETIPFRENTLQVTKRLPTMSFAGEFLAIDDTRTLGANDPTALWEEPRLVYAGVAQLPKMMFDLSWYSEYIRYWRERGLEGHRVDLHPQLLFGLPAKPLLEGGISAGVRETLYHTDTNGDAAASSWDGENSSARTMFDFTARAATTLLRDYSRGYNQNSGNPSDFSFFQHMIRPELTYTYIPYINQDDVPQFDTTDRIQATNQVRYGFSNYFKSHGKTEETPFSRELGFLKIHQSYNWRDDLHPFSDLALKLDIRPIDHLRVQFENSISVYGQGVTHYNINLQYYLQKNQRISINYLYFKHGGVVPPYFYVEPVGESTDAINGFIETPITKLLSGKVYMAYSFSTDRLIDASVHLLYHPQCWNLELIGTKTPDDTSITVNFSLPGFGKAFGLDILDL